MNYFFLLGSILTILNFKSNVDKYSQKSLIEFLIRSVDSSTNSITTIEYTLSFVQSNPDKEDTTYINSDFTVKFKAKHLNSAWHKLYMTFESKKYGQISSLGVQYDGKWIYREYTDSNFKKTVYPLTKVKSRFHNYLEGTHSEMLIPKYFRISNYFANLVKDTSIKDIQIEEVSVKGVQVYKLSIFWKDDDAFNNSKDEYLIRKADYLPIGYNSWFSIANTKHYNGYTIKYNSVNKPIPDSIFAINPAEIVVTEQSDNKISKTINVLEIGQTAPDFTAKLIDSSIFDLQKYKGKIVILDFWYRSCPPCLRAIPTLIEIDENYKRKGVVVLGINPYDNAGQIQDFFTFKGIKYNSTFHSANIAELYGITGYPTTIIIDQLGKIHKIHKGWGEDYKKDIIKSIDELLD